MFIKKEEINSNNFYIKTNEVPTKNINFAYSKLAKQLKQNKNDKIIEIKSQFNFSANDLLSPTSNKNNNFNLSVEQGTNINSNNIHINIDQNKMNSGSRSNIGSSNGLTKTTKDNSSMGSMRVSNSGYKQKSMEIDIEGPEELHSFYVNLIQQNKSLAFKFENLDKESELKINDYIEN
jgi:hypothetical protein